MISRFQLGLKFKYSVVFLFFPSTMLRSMTWECTCAHAVLNLAAYVGRSFHYHNQLAGAAVDMVKARLLSGRECALPPLMEEGYNTQVVLLEPL